jgi:ABC-2 type transport system permease protein
MDNLFVGPLVAILAVNISIIVSSRVNDPRAAEQISMVVILPVIAFFLAQLSGIIIINKEVVFLATFVLIIIDAFLVYVAVQLFQRETILTRWA